MRHCSRLQCHTYYPKAVIRMVFWRTGSLLRLLVLPLAHPIVVDLSSDPSHNKNEEQYFVCLDKKQGDKASKKDSQAHVSHDWYRISVVCSSYPDAEKHGKPVRHPEPEGVLREVP